MVCFIEGCLSSKVPSNVEQWMGDGTMRRVNLRARMTKASSDQVTNAGPSSFNVGRKMNMLIRRLYTDAYGGVFVRT